VGKDLYDVFENPERYEHIHEWLYPEVQRYGREIGDGAGGIRAIGRLTFFYHYDSLREAIRHALDDLCTHERVRQTEEFFQEHNLGSGTFADPPNPVVIIVCSVAGGTGCGTLLDAAFLLRDLSRPPLAIEHQFAYVFLPNVYYSSTSTQMGQRSYGNAYAALKELDFYALRPPRRQTGEKDELGVDYVVNWTAGRRLKIPGPPFSAMYLLEMRNEAGLRLEERNRGDLFDVLAESLFLDALPGQFSNAKRSNYSNISFYLSSAQNVEIPIKGIRFPQLFARRYATCGLSKIEIPVDAIRAACAAKLATEILGYVLRESQETNVKDDVRNEMASFQLDAEGLKDRFGTFWKDEIRNAVGSIFSGRTVADLGGAEELEKELRQAEERLVRSEGSDRLKWGAVVDALRRKTAAVAEEAKSSFSKWLSERCLENEARGLKVLLKEGGYLDHLVHSLRSLYSPPEEGTKAEYDRQRDRLQQEIDYWKERREFLLSELKASLGSIAIAALGAKTWTIDRLLARLRDAQEQYLLARAEDCLVEEAKKAAKALVETIASQRTPLEDFLNAVTSLRRDYDERRASFLATGSHVFFIRLFDEASDWDHYYRLDVSENKEPQPVDPARECKAFLRRALGGEAKLLDLVHAFERESQSFVDQRLREYCEKRFWDDFKQHPRQVNVLDHPWLKDSRRRSELIQQMIRSARPLLRQTTLPGAEAGVRRQAYLGICDPSTEPYRSFVEHVRREMEGISGPKYALEVVATGKSEEIYLYFSNYAFALPALPVVSEECHDAYATFYAQLADQEEGHQTSIPLHLSVKWEGRFDDLVILTSEEARKAHEIRSILLFGTILKVLTLREEHRQVRYQYKVGAPFYRMQPLGARRSAITLLRRDDAMRAALRMAIEQRERSLTAEQRVSYYWALQGWLYNPEMSRALPEYTLLENKLSEVHNELIAAGVDPKRLNLEAVPEEQRWEYVRNMKDSGLEWFGDSYPSIASLEVWAKPAASGASGDRM
jgi:hypothetical protein